MVKNPKILTHQTPDSAMFVTWQGDDAAGMEIAKAEIAKAYNSIEPVQKATASYGSLNVRSGMDRSDYEVFRPGEALPRKRSEVLAACEASYRRVSPIRNIFDTLTAFSIQGIKLVHPTPSGQALYDNWARQIRFYDRSHHFIDNLQLLGAAIPIRQYAKLNAKVLDELQKGIANASIFGDEEVFDIMPSPAGKAAKNVIPWSYTFQHPGSIKTVGGDLARYAGKTVYAMEISQDLLSKIRYAVTDEDKLFVASLPDYVRKAALDNKTIIPLDEKRASVFHYKKRDWDDWADPILLSVMDDIVLLQKMKLTDLAALDGAISHIRIWKLGSLEHKVMPTAAAFAKLNEVLKYAGNGQSFDLIWGPDLVLEEKTSDVYKYLGQEKYAPVLSSIFSGLGFPAGLTGAGGGEKGFTNNSMSLKTIIERLNYNRRLLDEFWTTEIKIFQRALGMRFPAKIEYKHAVLTDEAAYNSLLIDMLDRDVIPVSVMRDHLGLTPEVQDAVVRKEYRDRNTGKMAQKAGPFHDPEQNFGLKKIFVQSGTVSPSEVGVDLLPRKRGEKSPAEINETLAPKPAVPSEPKRIGVQFEGRPKNSKDTTTRKTKVVRPRTSAEEGSEFVNLTFWTKDAQENISKILSPIFLQSVGKQSLRQLTDEEVESLEHLKFAVLCNVEPYEEISGESIACIMGSPLTSHPEADGYWRTLVYTFMERHGVKPTIDDIRQIQCLVYAMYKLEV